MQIFTLFLALIVDLMGFGLVYPLVTELFAGEQGAHMAQGLSLNLRHFYLGLCFLLYPLAAFFGASLMATLSTRWGGKKTLLLCMGGITVSFLLMGAGVEFMSIALLLIGRALSGFLAGSQPLIQSALVSRAEKPVLTLMTLIVSVGIVIGPLIGGLFSDAALISWFTLSTPFYLAGLLGLLATLLILFTLPHNIGPKGEAAPRSKPLRVLAEGFRNKSLAPFIYVLLWMQIGFSLFFQLIQVFVSTTYDFASWELGLFNGFMGLAFIVAVLVGRAGKWPATALALTGISLILAMLFPSQPFVWVMAFLAAGFNMLAYGALIASFASATEKQAWALQVFALVMYLAWTVTGLTTNLIPFIGLRALIAFGGLFLILSALLMARQTRARRI